MAEARGGEISTRCLTKENQREHTFPVNNPAINRSNATTTTRSPRGRACCKNDKSEALHHQVLIKQRKLVPGSDIYL